MAGPSAKFQEYPCLIDQDDQEVFSLTAQETLLGRKTGEYTFPQDPKMSSSHVRFINNGGVVYVDDLESTNGTYLNNSKIDSGHPVKIKNGDILVIGKKTFKVHVPETQGSSSLAKFQLGTIKTKMKSLPNAIRRTRHRPMPKKDKMPTIRPVSSGRRLTAMIIDGLILTPIYHYGPKLLFNSGLNDIWEYLLQASKDKAALSLMFDNVLLPFCFFVMVMHFTYFFVTQTILGKSLGKAYAKIKLIDIHTQQELTIGMIGLREFIKLLSIAFLPITVVYTFSNRLSQAPHDKIAECVLVDSFFS